MKKWFIENGFEEYGDSCAKCLKFEENGLMFYIEYDDIDNIMTVSKFFKHYDMSYKSFTLKENDNIKDIIRNTIIDMKIYLTFEEYEHMNGENLLSDSIIEDVRWFREL